MDYEKQSGSKSGTRNIVYYERDYRTDRIMTGLESTVLSILTRMILFRE